MTDATELMKLVAARDALISDIESRKSLLISVKSQIAATCHHPITVKKSSYSDGGYDHVSRSCEWDECTICGKHFNLVERRGTHS